MDIDTLYQRYNEESISREQITRWLRQFEAADQSTALLLATCIDYWGYQRVHFGLQTLHERLMQQLSQDGFVADISPDHCYDQIDFSRSFCSKSGDLISYFYRKMNRMRSMQFSNLEALENSSSDYSQRALIILDDYVGTGCQFFSSSYRNRHAELFNRYGKVYVASLIANKQAIHIFEQVNQGKLETLIDIECGVNEAINPQQINAIRDSFNKIRPGQTQLVYCTREVSLLDPECTLNQHQQKQIRKLITKYTHNKYCHDLFNLMSHTVFFFQCPNDAPQILWDWDCAKAAGQWHPLFPRVSDLSIYAQNDNIPLSQQVTGKLWD